METIIGSEEHIQHTPASDASSKSASSVLQTSTGKKDSEREKRTYRACLHCRQRKSRCDLYVLGSQLSPSAADTLSLDSLAFHDYLAYCKKQICLALCLERCYYHCPLETTYSSGSPGKPPCERCIREQHDCVLGGSRRGGRRVKKGLSDPTAAAFPNPVHSRSGAQLIRPVPIPLQQSDYLSSTKSGPSQLPPWTGFNSESRAPPPLPREPPIRAGTTTSAKLTVDETIASADLTNPSDALDFLANVAERAEGNQLPPMNNAVYGQYSQRVSSGSGTLHDTSHSTEHQAMEDVIQYPPLSRGQLTVDLMKSLLVRYEERYHPFFPIANPMAMDPQNLLTIARQEPHLLAAILTVASKDKRDWWQIHEACSAHMQQLISSLVYYGSGSVEAVEALLILAEWVPRRTNSMTAIGRGEEDQAAWMHVGTAIRLGYLLGLDRTAFRSESELTAELNRKRLAWAACYMSDRQISVRIGKAFWSRGPGPMTALRATDFPSLQPRHNRDDLAAIFQANLELTQLLSNAHDVLYASKNRSAQLNSGGEYVKYIDDFRVSIRNWNGLWGSLTCSGPLKASLILSYEYLRLYVNAFAYQATLNRMVQQAQQAATMGQPANHPHPAYPFTDVAATPDARFIYDSIDAAKALLSTFNSFVDPVNCFRFMPLRYYLYVIYSACFLYKARSTGVMGGDTRGSVKRMIQDTVDRLQKASASPNDVGDRYSRLIRLLWRKPPGPTAGADITRPATAHAGGPGTTSSSNGQQEQTGFETASHPTSINTFSWLDLGAVGDFATNNNSIPESLVDGLDRFEDGSAGYVSGFDQSLLDPQQYAWNITSPPGIVF